MTEDTGNPKAHRQKYRLAGFIGTSLGVAVWLPLKELLDIKSFWLGLALGWGCIAIGWLLAQKIASK
jgi:hypothetical protein